MTATRPLPWPYDADNRTGSSFADALREINSLKDEGLVHNYAVAGAMAMVFWTEPVPTYDLDVLVSVPEKPTGLVSLDGWAAAKGFPVSQEHIIIHGVPTQLLPSPGPLADEAMRSAAELEYEDVKVRVVKPEYVMGSTSEDRHPAGAEPARPSPELLAALRAGKAALRRKRIALPLPEKVRQVLELQKACYPLLIRQRPVREWERPWDVNA